MSYQKKALSLKNPLRGISEKTLSIHYDKLYLGYINKKNEIEEKLQNFSTGKKDLSDANQAYSELRGLKDSETFAANGVFLHEHYFDVLGGEGIPDGELKEALSQTYGSIENFLNYFSACGMVARGWTVLAWNTNEKKLNIYTGDAHHQGGVWGAIPIIVLDVYEHAYFIDYGSDRKSYITDYLANLNWSAANQKYLIAKK